MGKTASGNMYAGHDGNVYKNTGNGWQKYDNGSWNSVNKPQPNWQGAQSSQQRTASESYQQRSASASSYNRSESTDNHSEAGNNRSGGGGYDRSPSETEDLDREAQNRSRGGQQSQHFQDFQRVGFDRSGGGGGGSGGGDRFGGGGGFDRFGGGGFGGGGFRGRR